MIRIIKVRVNKGVVTQPRKLFAPDGTLGVSKSSELEKAGKELKELIARKFGRSLHIREVDTGSCGACESEIIAANNPLYDVSRFGVNFVASPRHADALMVTGPVSKNMALALRKTYDAMPEPKFVISVGECALDGGAFKDSYYVEGGVSKILPVALHIPGCPPAPDEIISAILNFLKQG